ncbi:hypothetical protein AGMMS49521_0670 [Campylobacterota bacterium]|nr:hypothetical protein AGMMS49521_0670 [Campylobacterota bacterium]
MIVDTNQIRDFFKSQLGKKIALIALFALIAVHLLVTFGQIARYESVLRFGKTIALSTRSYDPFDAFRGRYITLNIASDEFATTRISCDRRCDQTLFVTYRDFDGKKSVIDNVYLEKPNTELAYLKLRGVYDSYNKTVSIDYPYDRLYMQEDAAIAVDRYSSRIFTRANDALVIVKALNGVGVVSDLIVGDQSISDLINSFEGEDD